MAVRLIPQSDDPPLRNYIHFHIKTQMEDNYLLTNDHNIIELSELKIWLLNIFQPTVGGQFTDCCSLQSLRMGWARLSTEPAAGSKWRGMRVQFYCNLQKGRITEKSGSEYELKMILWHHPPPQRANQHWGICGKIIRRSDIATACSWWCTLYH